MIGKRLAQYEVVEKLGEGGMGEVWKARDTALEREVAIKILPDAFAQDAERLARFEREAKLLASLNHQGIAAVHGLHSEQGRRFLAMELVPGEDLGRRLKQGPLDLEQALFVGVQVAEALEAAHAQGVVHRDLKPANIILTPDGRAKVLDFGLAKASEGPASGGSLSMSPTMTAGGTLPGMLLGTAAYMSPEQARGKPVDRRADVWAFGCVLFECLTGSGLYKGDSISDSLGAILHKEPDWSALPTATPPTIRLLLRRCLTKDADKRLHDIADARIELEQAIEDPTSSIMGLADAALSPPGKSRTALARPLLLALVPLLLAAGLVVGWIVRGAPEELPLRKLDLGIAVEPGAAPEAAISPDGRNVVFVHRGQLYLYALDALDPRPLEGTEGAFAPFWSPDSREIGYFHGDKLWKLPFSGGRGVPIGDLGDRPTGGRGASWSEDGEIVLSRGNTGLLRVSALGGQPQPLVPLAEDESDHHDPHLLPGGKGILFVAHPEGSGANRLSLYRDGSRTVLAEYEGQLIDGPIYTTTGHILFRRYGGEITRGLWALPFSLDRLEVEGEPFLVAPDVSTATVSRDGKRLDPLGGVRRDADGLALSPDGRHVAFVARDDENDTLEVWVRDLDRGTETRLTDAKLQVFDPTWSPSGQEIFFSAFNPDGPRLESYRVRWDASEPAQLFVLGAAVNQITPDGRLALTTRMEGDGPPSPTGNWHIWEESIAGEEEPRLLLGGEGRSFAATISPDGEWLAYLHARRDTRHVFLTRYPEATGRWQVSVESGVDVRWDPKGGRLYYREGPNLVEVAVGSGPVPTIGKPVVLFEHADSYALAPDGESFFVVEDVRRPEDEEEQRSGIKLVQNWIREFRK
jgi:Tol biopolymer transport system component